MMTDDQYDEWLYEMYKDEQAEEYGDPDDYEDEDAEGDDDELDG